MFFSLITKEVSMLNLDVILLATSFVLILAVGCRLFFKKAKSKKLQ